MKNKNGGIAMAGECERRLEERERESTAGRGSQSRALIQPPKRARGKEHGAGTKKDAKMAAARRARPARSALYPHRAVLRGGRRRLPSAVESALCGSSEWRWARERSSPTRASKTKRVDCFTALS